MPEPPQRSPLPTTFEEIPRDIVKDITNGKTFVIMRHWKTTKYLVKHRHLTILHANRIINILKGHGYVFLKTPRTPTSDGNPKEDGDG